MVACLPLFAPGWRRTRVGRAGVGLGLLGTLLLLTPLARAVAVSRELPGALETRFADLGPMTPAATPRPAPLVVRDLFIGVSSPAVRVEDRSEWEAARIPPVAAARPFARPDLQLLAVQRSHPSLDRLTDCHQLRWFCLPSRHFLHRRHAARSPWRRPQAPATDRQFKTYHTRVGAETAGVLLFASPGRKSG